MYQCYVKKQLPTIGRLRKYIGFPEKKALIEAFVFSNFEYCPLACDFSTMRSTNKIEYIMTILAPMIVFLQKQINHQWK